jgi:tRNA uridine 5-carbamoylmethylation protein Kti12
MPLVIISGQPCSGKTTFAAGLARYLEALPAGSGTGSGATSGSAGGVARVVVVNDEALGVKKREGYSSTYQRISYGRSSHESGHAVRA